VDVLSKKYICPICGYDKLKEDPYCNGVLASCEICPCCGFEFGVTYFNELDEEIGIHSEEQAITYYRKMWILTGALWFYEQIYERDTLPDNNCTIEELKEIEEEIKRDKPANWSLANQLKNINIDLEKFMKENSPIKHGYYKVKYLDLDEEMIYEYRGGIYARNIKNNEYAEIMHIYNIAQFMDKENLLD
jgi:hypothetical protein